LKRTSYQLLDSGNFSRLEQVGPIRVVRPAAAAVWEPSLPAKDWSNVDATFIRTEQKSGVGNGEWKCKDEKLKTSSWPVAFDDITLQLKLTSFGHLGLFAEQEKNWREIRSVIATRRAARPSEPIKILNLFAYTGAATLFAAQAGAEVVHLDASKGTVKWARDNAEASGLASKPIRWIVDDAQEFVQKEIRRGNKYHGILLDPPTYGRGGDGMVWKIEEHMTPFLKDLAKLMADDFLFLLLSSHSPGYTPISLQNQLQQILAAKQGTYAAGEMTIMDSTGKPLPSGADCLFLTKP
jgi:23S rRNA (cytosine1962-C5)-methyltransferase